jgi:hypothetical protein
VSSENRPYELPQYRSETTPDQSSGSRYSAELELGSVRSDPALIAAGWVRRHLVDPDRARESVELYESMGFEVLVLQLTPDDFGPQCQECASIVCRSHVLIYTRKTQS